MDALFKVVITGKVSQSLFANATLGDTVTMSLLVDPTPVTRVIDGHMVDDAIERYGVCDDKYLLKFTSGIHINLGDPPIDQETFTPSPLLFSLMQSRPVYDGLFLSYSPDIPTDVPLLVHGSYTGSAPALYYGRFGINTLAYTFPSIKIGEAVGTYKPKGPKHNFYIWRDWPQNIVATWEITEITISKAI
ncbi:MAG: hypothetical protein SGPRY_011718 [Prymnesium sp.]